MRRDRFASSLASSSFRVLELRRLCFLPKIPPNTAPPIAKASRGAPIVAPTFRVKIFLDIRVGSIPSSSKKRWRIPWEKNLSCTSRVIVLSACLRSSVFWGTFGKLTISMYFCGPIEDLALLPLGLSTCRCSFLPLLELLGERRHLNRYH